MKESYEVVEYKGFKINIYTDDCAESPREWDNLGKMICFHRGYSLGDKHTFKSASNFFRELAMDLDPKLEDILYYWESGKSWDILRPNDKAIDERVNKAIEKSLDKHCIIIPLYLYNHSGITMNTTGFSCPWDSGQVGWIYVSIEDIKKEYNWKVLTKERRKLIEDRLRSEVKTYDDFIQGNVFGYIINDPDENEKDACWGYYGYDHEKSGLLDSARDHIDWVRGNKDETQYSEQPSDFALIMN